MIELMFTIFLISGTFGFCWGLQTKVKNVRNLDSIINKLEELYEREND
jgi:hypothetical protein